MDTLKTELEGPVHALSIQVRTSNLYTINLEICYKVCIVCMVRDHSCDNFFTKMFHNTIQIYGCKLSAGHIKIFFPFYTM